MNRSIFIALLTSILTLCILAGTAHAAQPLKLQLTETSTFIINWDGSAVGGILGGVALVAPIQKGTFLRFVGSGGVLNTIGTQIFIPTARVSILIGITPVPRVNLLAGAGLAIIFPSTGPEITPVGILAVNLWVVPGKFSVAFPTVITAKGIVLNTHLVWTLPEPK